MEEGGYDEPKKRTLQPPQTPLPGSPYQSDMQSIQQLGNQLRHTNWDRFMQQARPSTNIDR